MHYYSGIEVSGKNNTPDALYGVKSPGYPLNRKVVGPYRDGLNMKGKGDFLFLPRIELWFLRSAEAQQKKSDNSWQKVQITEKTFGEQVVYKTVLVCVECVVTAITSNEHMKNNQQDYGTPHEGGGGGRAVP